MTTIAATIQSVLSQIDALVEYIVIDGGSNDGTIEAIERFGGQVPVFVTERDRGLYDAMNKGLDRATGDFVCFMNAGDCFATGDALHDVLDRVTKRDRCYFARAEISGLGVRYENPLARTDASSWLRHGIPSHQAVFYPQAFTKRERYDLALGSVADTDFTFRCFDEFGFEFVDTLVARFSLGGVSNRFADFDKSKRTMLARTALVARHRRWFSPGFGIVYRSGPMVGWFVQRLFGDALLATMRNFKGAWSRTRST